jgi:uncharacterized damage-inducible protein DinB
MAQERDPARYAADIAEARQRLLEFVRGCDEGDWHACVAEGDPRPVGVIVDHVAHAYEYLTRWIRDILAGATVTVNAETVDELNEEHAAQAAGVSRAAAADHLMASGDTLIELVRGLTPADLDLGDGRVRRLTEVAIRHPDSHRSEIQSALASPR